MSNTTEEIVTRREAVYGEKVETHRRIAQVWSGITGLHINPADVPLMMIGLKAVRTQICPDYSDNSDDVEGYLDIFRAVVGEDMVHARSVTEYLEQKETFTIPVGGLPCANCNEPECLHNPVSQQCMRQGFTHLTWESGL